eukprot:4157960-Pleurochrysis_carterae.AAC.3
MSSMSLQICCGRTHALYHSALYARAVPFGVLLRPLHGSPLFRAIRPTATLGLRAGRPVKDASRFLRQLIRRRLGSAEFMQAPDMPRLPFPWSPSTELLNSPMAT